MHHYLTKYEENGSTYVEAWIQINVFGRCFCIPARPGALRKSNIMPKSGRKSGYTHTHTHKGKCAFTIFSCILARFSALYTYTYTYTQRKLRIYDDFMHFWPIFGIIHIHIHIHIKILLRFFAGNGVLISCADRTLTVPRPVTKQIKKAEPPHGCGALL